MMMRKRRFPEVKGATTTVAAAMTKMMEKGRVLTDAPVLRRLILLDEADLIRTLAFDVYKM
jgi:hypothetical protein